LIYSVPCSKPRFATLNVSDAIFRGFEPESSARGNPIAFAIMVLVPIAKPYALQDAHFSEIAALAYDISRRFCNWLS